jgi:hypothetical protein
MYYGGEWHGAVGCEHLDDFEPYTGSGTRANTGGVRDSGWGHTGRDATIVNVALPSIQHGLGFSPPAFAGAGRPLDRHHDLQ